MKNFYAFIEKPEDYCTFSSIVPTNYRNRVFIIIDTPLWRYYPGEKNRMQSVSSFVHRRTLSRCAQNQPSMCSTYCKNDRGEKKEKRQVFPAKEDPYAINIKKKKEKNESVCKTQPHRERLGHDKRREKRGNSLQKVRTTPFNAWGVLHIYTITIAKLTETREHELSVSRADERVASVLLIHAQSNGSWQEGLKGAGGIATSFPYY